MVSKRVKYLFDCFYRMKVFVVLGGGITQKGVISKSVHDRIDLAVRKFSQGNKIIMSGKWYGGYNFVPVTTEARAMKEYAVSCGALFRDVILEEKSKDTIGNAYFVKKLLDSKGVKSFVVVTSDFHVLRSKFIFSKVFGSKYKIEFLGSKSGEFDKRIEIEKKKILFLKKWLAFVRGSIGWKFFMSKVHPFYARKAPVSFESLRKKYSK
jgi:uncharacterized SAM-binding protein YcdF (DUF218 family)